MKVPENREIIEADNNVSPVQIDYIFVALLLVEWIQRVIRMMQDWGDENLNFQPLSAVTTLKFRRTGKSLKATIMLVLCK